MEVSIRKATPADEPWINEQYAIVEFLPSKVSEEYIAIAEMNGTPVGLGRLVPIPGGANELGGMYVLPDFRGKGVAGKIVAHLIEKHNHTYDLWCIPFAHLLPFYGSFGFKEVDIQKVEAPEKVIAKYRYCDGNYNSGVGFMKM